MRSRSYSLQLKTAKEQLDNALSQEKELNQLKSRFVSMVFHEFRNPLNSISGMAQILKTFEISCQSSEIIFTIRDHGIGIPAEDIPQLFNAFYRASNSEGFQGTALGLTIAKQYVALHQGAIAVTSELNVGTTFKVTIPTLLQFRHAFC